MVAALTVYDLCKAVDRARVIADVRLMKEAWRDPQGRHGVRAVSFLLMSDDFNRLYGDLAHLWPLISSPEEYVDEAAYCRRELRRHLGPGRHRILELGVGGGHNLSHLTGEFDATAVDLSEAMLAHSRRLNPSVTHYLGDMRTIRLGETFDAVLVHDAISYMTTEDDLLAVFNTARAHLRDGGVFLAAPDFYVETFKSPWVHYETRTFDSVELTYFQIDTDLDPADTQIESALVFFIHQGGELRIEVDRHVTGLFPIATWERLLTQAGFIPEKVDYPVSEDGRDSYLWTARVSEG
jgi:hypothetical protein